MKKLRRKLLTIAVVGLMLISITSCIGIDSTMSFREDGSGSIQLSYAVSKLVAHLGKLEESDTSIPLPVGLKDFERTVARNPGLVLENYNESEDEENVFIDAELTFDSVSTLNNFLKGTGEDVIRLDTADGNSLLQFIVYPGSAGDVSGESVDVLAQMFQDYSLNFIVEAPKSIRSRNLGESGPNDRIAALTLLVSNILKENEPVTWEISW